MSESPVLKCLFRGSPLVPVKKEKTEEDASSTASSVPTSAKSAKTTAVKAKGARPPVASPTAEPPPTADLPFSSDKKLYNKFNYKLRLAPAPWHEEWKVVRSQEHVSPAMFKAFVEKVMDYDAKGKVSKYRKISNMEVDLREAEWLSWEEAKNKEGAEVLLAQIEAKTVQSRVHPRLPASANIPYPQNLQIRYLSEKEQVRQSRTDEEEYHVDVETAEAFDDFENKLKRPAKEIVETAASSSWATATATPKASSVAAESEFSSQPALSAEEQRDRAAVAHVRKAHNAWDRCRREFEGVIEHSSVNLNTKGCKFESDLAALIEEGNAADASIIKLEQKFICDQRFSPTEVEDVVRIGKQIKDLTRKGAKISNAMKQWFKL